MQINKGPIQAGGSVGGEIRPPSAPPSMPPTEQAPSSASVLNPVATETPSDMPLPPVEDSFAPPEQVAPPKTLPDRVIVPDASVSAQQGVNIPFSPDAPSQNIDPEVLADNPVTDSDPSSSPVAPPQVPAGSAPVNLEDHHGLEAIIAGNSGSPQSPSEPNLGQVANADQFNDHSPSPIPTPPSQAPEISADFETAPFIDTSGMPPDSPTGAGQETDVNQTSAQQVPPELGQDSLKPLVEAEDPLAEIQRILNTPESQQALLNFLRALGYTGDSEVETNRGEAQ